MADDDVPPTVEDALARAMCDALVEAPLDEPCEGCRMQATAVVAAVRAMSPEQHAQLIGGMTETGTFSRVVDDVPVATRVRVVGHWRAEP